MNSTDNNTFQNAALKVFSDLYDLIKEVKIDDKPNKSYLLDLNNDILDKK